MSLEMLEVLKELRKKVAVGFVGGSDLVKITEQLRVTGNNSAWRPSAQLMATTFELNRENSVPVLDDFDYAFAENGLTAYRLGTQLPSQSFIKYVGEERYKKLVNFILHYLADLEIPIKRHAHAHSFQ